MRTDKASRNAKRGGNSKPKGSNFSKYIRYVPFLASLSGDELEALEKVVIDRNITKDDVVLLEEDTCKYFYLIYSGKVKAVKVDSDGGEHIVAIHKKGDFFGEVGILDGKTSPATVIAMENTQIGLIARYHFEKCLLSNQKVLNELLHVFCARLRASWLKIKVLGFNDAERRVRATLKLLALQDGVVQPEGSTLLPRLTHRDLAHYASLSRETVTRQLQKLARAKEILILENREIQLYPCFFKNSEIL